MKTLMFEGHSDDTFGELTTGEDHDNCANNAPIIFKVLSLSAGAGVLVIGHYHLAPDGVWTIGLAPVQEDSPIPDWPTRFRLSDRGYSPALEIDVPDDAHVELYQ